MAIDGSKFKAVNNRDKNFTTHKLEQRIKQIEESIDRYMHALDTADRTQLARIFHRRGRRNSRKARYYWCSRQF